MFELSRKNRNNQMNGYNPFREMEEFERNFFANPFFGTQDLAEFKTDVIDEGDYFSLEADLPGFEKKDINLDIDNDVLTVSAERHSEFEEKDKKDRVVRMERSYGSYSRQFDVSMIDVDNIKAKYENGVLKLVLPKKEEKFSTSRRLEIE